MSRRNCTTFFKFQNCVPPRSPTVPLLAPAPTKFIETLRNFFNINDVNMNFSLLILLILNYYSLATNSDKNKCSQFKSDKPSYIDRHHIYSLWPDLISPQSLQHGETLLGMDEVLKYKI